MSRIVRGALLQAEWTGDKESMIQKHEKYAHEAAKQGAQVMLFQELFYGPYFCQVQDPQYFSYTEHIPDGPTTKRMQALAKETGMVLVVPMYEEDSTAPRASTTTPPRSSTRTARTSASTARRTSRTSRASGRSSTSGPGTWDTRCSRRRSARSACTSATTGTSRRAPGRSASTARRWSSSPAPPRAACPEYLWRIEQVSHAVANGYFVGTINRVGIEPLGDDDFYGQSYFCDPRGQFIGEVGDAHKEELLVRDMDLDKVEEVRQTWQFYRDRRPDAYEDLVRP